MRLKKGRHILLLTLVASLLAGATAQAAPDRLLDAYCGVPWGASQAVAKEVMAKSIFKAELRIEDKDILVYSGEFGGFPAEFSFSFINGGLAGGIILFPDTADGAAFAQLTAVHNERLGPPDLTRNNANGPVYTWLFRSAFKPPPDFAYISILKTTGSFLHRDQKGPAVAIFCYDDQLERQYRAMRAAAKNK